MAVIRDMIPPFELYQPTEVEDAVRLMRQHGDKGWVLAGGLDTFDWFKDRIKRPEAVIDLAALDAIQGISGGADGGLDIGAMTSLTEIAENADVMGRYPLLGEAAGLVATPQIRNQGHPRRQHRAGHALLVLPERVAPATARGATSATRRPRSP